MIFNIQVDLAVDAQTEKQAEQQVFDFFKAAWFYDEMQKYKIDEWNFLEFIPTENNNDN